MSSVASVHKHKQSRKNKKLSPYQELLDVIVDLAVVLAPLSLVPQLIAVWRDGSNAGVALSTWLLTGVITIPLIMYDVSHKAYKLTLMHTLIVLISLGIVIGLLVR